VRDDLRVHARLAHAARDQLRVLPPEIYDQDRAIFDRRLRMELKELRPLVGNFRTRGWCS
jgi:hypothetical protein